LEGVWGGEPGLSASLSETEDEVRQVTNSHGWSPDSVHVFDLNSSPEAARTGSRYTFFHPAEVELDEVVKRVFDEAERVKPSRVIVDSLTELRLLSRDPLRYRRQVLAFKQFFSAANATPLLLTEQPARGDRAPDDRRG
jgi:circadian clock protein KaiC